MEWPLTFMSILHLATFWLLSKARENHEFQLAEGEGATYRLESSSEIQRIGSHFGTRDTSHVEDPLITSAILRVALIFTEKDSQLISLRVTDCSPIPCISDQTHVFEWRNYVIQDVFVTRPDSGQKERWSIALSFLYLLQQKQEYGAEAEVSFQAVNESSARTLRLKSIGFQKTILPTLEYSSSFDQKVIYSTSSDGYLQAILAEDSIKIDAYSYTLTEMKIRTKIVRLEKDTKEEGIRDEALKCDATKIHTTKDCLKHLKTILKLQLITNSIGNLYMSKMKSDGNYGAFGSEHKKTKCILGSTKELAALNSYASRRSAEVFLRVLRRISTAPTDEITACLKLKENEPNLHGIVNALAISGHINAYEAIQKYATQNGKANSVMSTYLSSLPFSLSLNWHIVEDIMKLVTASNDLDQNLILSAASTLGRQLKSYAQDKEKLKKAESFLDIFVRKFEACMTDDCFDTMLRSFSNLGHPRFAELMRNRLCTSFSFDFLALQYLKTLPLVYWSSNEFRRKLWKIFSNRCPTAKEQATRMLAAEFLIISSTRENSDETVMNLLTCLDDRAGSGGEIRAYVVSLVSDLANDYDHFKQIYDHLRKQRISNEFLKFLNGAQSGARKRSLEILGRFRPFYQLDLNFGNGLLKRSNTELGIELDGKPSTILGFELFSAGTGYILGLLGAATDQAPPANSSHFWPSSNDRDPADDQSLLGGLKLTFFDHRLPPIIFFNSETQLMSAVWAADGSPLVTFAGTFFLNEFRLTLPLTNGMTINARLGGALSLKVGGSVEISLWYRSLKSTVYNKGSFFTSGSLSITSDDYEAAQQLSNYTINFSSEFGANFLTEGDFYNTPVKLCFQIDENPVDVRLKIDHFSGASKKLVPLINMKRHFDGSCVSAGKGMDLACSTIYD